MNDTSVQAVLQQCLPFTVLKRTKPSKLCYILFQVATVLTVYGIETIADTHFSGYRIFALQQCLPFTVLKLYSRMFRPEKFVLLQQCLPFTVLKQYKAYKYSQLILGCNSAYRLRY